MKLFIWHGVLGDYSSGIAFAVADTKEGAIKAILEEEPSCVRTITQTELSSSEPEIHELDKSFGEAFWGQS